MTEPRVIAVPTRPNRLVDELDALLEKRAKHAKRIADADAKRAKKLAKIKKQWDKEVGKAPKKLAGADEALADFVWAHQDQLTRRLSKTMKRKMGEVQLRMRPFGLEMPADEQGVVEDLLAMRGGKKYLRQIWEVDRPSLLQAPPPTFRRLRRRGVWRGKRRAILVKSPTDKGAKTISLKRYNERQLRK